MNRLQEIEQRLAAIKGEIEVEGADLSALEAEVKALKEERKGILEYAEHRKKLTEEIANLPKVEVIKDFKEERKLEVKDIHSTPEYRSAFFKALLGKEMNEAEKRDWLAGAGASAEAVVPIETSNMIFDYMVKTAPMLNEITLLRVAGNLRFAVEGARANAALHVQNNPVNAAADTLTFVTLGGLEFMKVHSISATVRTMSIPAFEAWLVKALAEDIAEQLESEIILGTNVTGGIEDANVWQDTVNGVDYGVGVTYDDLVDLISLLPARYDKNAKWLMNKAMYYQQIAKLQDANGNPIAIPDFANGAQMRILGYPVLISDLCGAGNAYLGDYTKIVGNLPQDIKIESSEQSGFLRNSVDFRGTCIFDCDHATPDAFVKLFT